MNYLARWANWDGKAYQDIANSGYIPGLTVFFPLFPILIKLLSFFGISSFYSGMILSNLFTFLSLFFLYKLTLIDFSTKVAKRVLFAFLIFPTGFYLVTHYNESLAAFCVISSFYYARTKRWILAGLFAGAAGVTRLTGTAAIIGVLIEYLILEKENIKGRTLKFMWESKIRRFFVYLLFIIFVLNILTSANHTIVSGVSLTILEILKWPFILLLILLTFSLLKFFVKIINFKKIFNKNFLYVCFSIFPLLLYLIYQKITFGTFFSFLDNEIIWGKKFSPFWQGPLDSIRYVISSPFLISEYSARVHLRIFLFTVALYGLILSYRKLRLSYTIFYLIALLIPLSSGTLIDFPRYSLILFPLFIVLGLIENEFIQKLGVIIFISLLSFLLILFFNSYFFM